jgi:hypothetical protein
VAHLRHMKRSKLKSEEMYVRVYSAEYLLRA